MAKIGDPPLPTGKPKMNNPVFWELWNGNTSAAAGTILVYPISSKIKPKKIPGTGVPWDVGPKSDEGSRGQGVWQLSCTAHTTLAIPSIIVAGSDVNKKGLRYFYEDCREIKDLARKLLAIKKPCDPLDVPAAMILIVKLNKLTLKRLQISILPQVHDNVIVHDIVREGLCGERPTQLTKNLNHIIRVASVLADLTSGYPPPPQFIAPRIERIRDYYTENCKWIYLGAYGSSVTGTDKPLIPPSIPHPDDPGLTIIIRKRTTKIKSITGLEGKSYSLKNKKKMFDLDDVPWYYPLPIKLREPKTGYKP
jgi:hypothetical protein